MWKITFQYSDGGAITVRGKGKEIPLHLAQKYYKDYGIHSDGGMYQRSPYKNNPPEHMTNVIRRLKKDEHRVS